MDESTDWPLKTWPLPYSRKQFRDWRDRGIVGLGVPPTLSALVDLGLGRQEILSAVARHTAAWDELLCACRRLRVAELDVAAIEDEGDSLLTPNQERILDAWFQPYPALDVPWMREWTERAVFCVRVLLQAEPGLPYIAVQDVFLHEEGGYPIPDPFEMIRRPFEWQDGEYPPHPRFESQDEFVARMKEAYHVREAMLGSGPERRTTKHVEWFALHHVGGEKIKAIAERDKRTKDAVRQGLNSFARRVGLTRHRSLASPPNFDRS